MKHIEDNPEFIQPARRRNEILVRLREDDLRDLSVSRTTFDWGIPVPGRSQARAVRVVRRVDQLPHRRRVAGEARRRRFLASRCAHHRQGHHLVPLCHLAVHVVVPRACPSPKRCLGTASSPPRTARRCRNPSETSSTRWSSSPSTRRIPSVTTSRTGVYGSDIPFSESNLVYVQLRDLADVMGNLVHRATNLCSKNCGGAVPDCAVDVVFDVAALRVQTELAIKSFEVQRCCELAINAMKDTNKYLTDSAPWAVKGEGAAERKAVIIRSTLEAVYAAAHFLSPFIPDATDAIFQKLGTPRRRSGNSNRKRTSRRGPRCAWARFSSPNTRWRGGGRRGEGRRGKEGGDKKAADGKAAAPQPKPKKTPAAAAPRGRIPPRHPRRHHHKGVAPPRRGEALRRDRGPRRGDRPETSRVRSRRSRPRGGDAGSSRPCRRQHETQQDARWSPPPWCCAAPDRTERWSPCLRRKEFPTAKRWRSTRFRASRTRCSTRRRKCSRRWRRGSR